MLEDGQVSQRADLPSSNRHGRSSVGNRLKMPWLCGFPDDIDYATLADFFISGPEAGDKLGGYGDYPQSGQPRCDRGCNEGQLLFQIESSPNGILDSVYLGDCGRLFVFLCELISAGGERAHRVLLGT